MNGRSITSTRCVTLTHISLKFLQLKKWNWRTWVQKPGILFTHSLKRETRFSIASTWLTQLKPGWEKWYGCKNTTLYTIVSELILSERFSVLGRKEFEHELFGWGVFEGQSDKFGNTCGEGRWYCTDATAHLDLGSGFKRPTLGIVQEGCWKDDNPVGYSKY